MGLPDGSGGPHTFVDDIAHPQLSSDDRHHLSRVLRLRSGDSLTVSDGAGQWLRCLFGDPLVVAGDVVTVSAPDPQLTVAFALTKGSKPETVVQKLTELGIDKIAPFTADRSVARWEGARGVKQMQRLRRIAREAAMQSRRVWIPEVLDLAPFAAVAALPGAVRAERGERPISARDTTVLIGPEGGWSSSEHETLSEVGLADHVLRAETAAIVAATLMATRRGSGSTDTSGP